MVGSWRKGTNFNSKQLLKLKSHIGAVRLLFHTFPDYTHTRVGVCVSVCEVILASYYSTFDSVCHLIGRLRGNVVPAVLILLHLIHESVNRKHVIWHSYVWFTPSLPLQAFLNYYYHYYYYAVSIFINCTAWTDVTQ